MSAPDSTAAPSLEGAVPDPDRPRNERRRHGGNWAWQTWIWPVVGLLAGLAVVAGARFPPLELPLVNLPLVGPMTYAQDNMPRATAVAVCGGLAALFSLARCFRLALLGQGFAGGLLTASALEKWREYAEMSKSAHPPPGAGELTRQAAADTAKTLAAIRPEIAAYLLPLGCLLGITAALAGGWLAARRASSI